MASKRDLKHWAVVLLGGLTVAGIGIALLERESPESDPAREHPLPRPDTGQVDLNLPVGTDAAAEAMRFRKAMALLRKGEKLRSQRKWKEAAEVYARVIREYPVVHDPEQDFTEVHLTEELEADLAYLRCMERAPAAPTFDSVDALAEALRKNITTGQIARLERMLDRCGLALGEADRGEYPAGGEDPAVTGKEILASIERTRAQMDWSEAEVSRFGVEVPVRGKDGSFYFVFHVNDGRWTWAGFRRIHEEGANRRAASVEN